MKVLITGASGFIGQALVQDLISHGFEVTITTRSENDLFPTKVTQIIIGDISSDTDWSTALESVECVIHLAGRAHILNEEDNDPLTEFRRVNTAGTINLAHQAIKLGVKRFVFISSIGVNGNKNTKPFTPNDIPNPVEPYALSKYEAELGIQQAIKNTGMEIVIIRPPLVYGSNAPGNFARLIKVINKGVPLPLGSINNLRSFVAVENVIDLIRICTTHPKAANQTFLVSDDNDLSTSDLLRRIAKALGKPPRLLPLPASIFTLIATIFGKKELAQRLCGSLQVDISHTKNTLNWTPPISVDEGLQKTADAYLKQLNQNK